MADFWDTIQRFRAPAPIGFAFISSSTTEEMLEHHKDSYVRGYSNLRRLEEDVWRTLLLGVARSPWEPGDD